MTDTRYNKGFSVHDATPAAPADGRGSRPSVGSPAVAQPTSRQAAARARRRSRGFGQSSFMRYASDNRLVRFLNGILTGPYRHVFYGLVILAVALGLYFPVRDLYIAKRTTDILTQQVAIREKYKDSLQSEVDSYLSKEGIEEAARTELGMVMPGEKTITVTGDDEDSGSSEDSDDSGSSSGEPSTASEVEAAEAAVFESSPWYLKVLDTVFFFSGTEGQAVVSTGATGSSAE